MSCFFRKKRNRVHLTEYDTDNNPSTNADNPSTNANNIMATDDSNNESYIDSNIAINETQNMRDYTDLLANRYMINSDGEIRFNNRLILDDIDITGLSLSNYDVKSIISDNNWLYNYNLKLVKNINTLLYNKLKLENENLNLKIKIKSLESNYIENTKDILIENERLNDNIKTIMDVNNADDLYLCTICMDNIRDIIITPCYHSVVCNKCINKLKCCPICRSSIKNTIKYYF